MKLEGKDIKEVWDYRLSTATPLIVREDGFWHVQVWLKENPDYDPNNPETVAKPAIHHTMDIEHTEGDERDTSKIIPCFEYLLTVRDQFSLPDIEERKKHVKKINNANKALAELGSTDDNS